MKWKEARKLLFAGKKIRRAAWVPGCFIFLKEGEKHIQLAALDTGCVDWKPYVEDFARQSDWEEFIAANVVVVWNGVASELQQKAWFDISDSELLELATRAIMDGNVEGLMKDPLVDLSEFVIDRFPNGNTLGQLSISRRITSSDPWLLVRPKTPF